MISHQKIGTLFETNNGIVAGLAATGIHTTLKNRRRCKSVNCFIKITVNSKYT